MIYYLSIIYGSHAIYLSTIHLYYLSFLLIIYNIIHLCSYLSSIFIIYFLFLIFSMYYLLMIYFSIFNIYYQLPISHRLSMELPFILLYIIYLSSITYLLSIIYLYYFSSLLMSPTFLSTYHLCVYPLLFICLYYLSVCMYVHIYIHKSCWFSCRTLFNTCHSLYAQAGSSFHWHPHPSMHGMVLYATYMWPSLLTITTKLVDFQGWCLPWPYCIEEEAVWVRWAIMAEVIQQLWSRNRNTGLSWSPMSLAWVKPGVTGMTCICQLVSYLST